MISNFPASIVPLPLSSVCNPVSGCVQNQLLDVLVPLAVDSRLPSVGVRAQALRCIGDAVARHGPSQVALGSKLVGDAGSEPALHAVLRAALRAGSPRERAAAEYVFRCFCEVRERGRSAVHQPACDHKSGCSEPPLIMYSPMQGCEVPVIVSRQMSKSQSSKGAHFLHFCVGASSIYQPLTKMSKVSREIVTPYYVVPMPSHHHCCLAAICVHAFL